MKSGSSMLPPRKLPPLQALKTFEAAARHQSFRLAAAELGVTPTAVSHQIRLLEETLGQPLFERRVRQVVTTPAGDRLFPVLRDGFDAMAAAVAALRPPAPRRAVTLTALGLFTAKRLIPALGRFRERFPGHELRLHASDDVVDLGTGIADLAVRYGRGPFPGLIAETLVTDRFGVVASPRLGLHVPEDLAGVPLLRVEWRRQERVPDWRAWAMAAGRPEPVGTAVLSFTDDAHAIQAAIAGHGALIASLTLVADDLAAGLLEAPFGPELPGDGYHLLIPPAERSAPDVMAVRDWLLDVAGGKIS